MKALFFDLDGTLLDSTKHIPASAKAALRQAREKGVKVYKVIFVVMIISGAVMTSSLAWDISDTFNGLMMIPNLIGVVSLLPLVAKITNNYVARAIKGEDIEPALSYDPAITEEMKDLVD